MTHTSDTTVLDASSVTVAVPGRGLSLRRRNAAALVEGLDLIIRRGETVGLVGESGSGKSTAARAFARLILSRLAVPLLSGVTSSLD